MFILTDAIDFRRGLMLLEWVWPLVVGWWQVGTMTGGVVAVCVCVCVCVCT